MQNQINENLYEKFLDLLGKQKNKPSLDYLNDLVSAFFNKIPFENISKIYYKNKFNLYTIPSFEQYLNGIETFHFGGTCYSNNYYLNLLLDYLGFDVKLCGADMRKPDLHVANIVKIEGIEYLVDTGYASPFIFPIPLNSNDNQKIIMGNDDYVIEPKDALGNTRIRLFRDQKEQHGYLLKPQPRKIKEFDDNILDSFGDSAVFMNSILLTKYISRKFVVISNFSLIVSGQKDCRVTKLSGVKELTETIEECFFIPKIISSEVIENMKNLKDAWE